MGDFENWVPEFAAIDVIALVLLVMGVIMGVLRGLGPVFGMLLWLMISLWLGKVLTPVIIDWMPNSPAEGSAKLTTFGLVAGVLLVLPSLARLLGGAGGKKKAEPAPQYKPFGVLVGIACAIVFFTLLTPFAYRVPFVSKTFNQGHGPTMALEVAESATWLFPPDFRSALKSAGAGAPTAGARNRSSSRSSR